MRASSLILGFLMPTTAFAAVSSDAICGGKSGFTCVGSRWGSCCSQYGWCGRTSDYCSIKKGCQAAFGTCNGAGTNSASSSSTRSTSTGVRTSSISRSSASMIPSIAPARTSTLSTIVSSTSSTVPATPRATCGIQGNAKSGIGTELIYNRPAGGCKNTCRNYSDNGKSCRVYAVSGNGCAVYVSSPAPTFDQLVNPATGTGWTFYDTSCA